MLYKRVAFDLRSFKEVKIQCKRKKNAYKDQQ